VRERKPGQGAFQPSYRAVQHPTRSAGGGAVTVCTALLGGELKFERVDESATPNPVATGTGDSPLRRGGVSLSSCGQRTRDASDVAPDQYGATPSGGAARDGPPTPCTTAMACRCEKSVYSVELTE